MNNQSKRIFLRSQEWFDDPEHADMTALYVERYMNYGLTRDELQSGRPIIGIAQTGSDLTPCNRHHKELAERVKAGIRDAGGIPMEFPVHPIADLSCFQGPLLLSVFPRSACMMSGTTDFQALSSCRKVVVLSLHSFLFLPAAFQHFPKTGKSRLFRLHISFSVYI